MESGDSFSIIELFSGIGGMHAAVKGKILIILILNKVMLAFSHYFLLINIFYLLIS